MDESIKKPEIFSAEEMLRTEILINQALIDILIAKKIISEEELANSLKIVQLRIMNEFYETTPAHAGEISSFHL